MIRCLGCCRPSASHGASLSLHGLHVCISLLELTPGAPEPNAQGAAPSTSAYSCAPLAQTRNLHGRLHWAAALPSPRDRQRALADEERAEGGGRDHGAPGRPDGRPLRPRERRAKVLAELCSAAVGLSSSCICPGNSRGSGALSARCPSPLSVHSREFCAEAAAEFLKWSAKHAGGGAAALSCVHAAHSPFRAAAWVVLLRTLLAHHHHHTSLFSACRRAQESNRRPLCTRSLCCGGCLSA